VLYDTGSHVLDSLLFVLGLDEPAPDTRAEVLDVRRDKEDEPTHDFHARFVLQGAAHGDTVVEFRVSRTHALARALKVYGSIGTLTISGGFALHPMLTVGGKSFRLEAFVGDVQPSNVMGCFLQEHRALQAVAADRSARSVLDAERFTLLTSLMERMVEQ
jgi:predicted dehydrogenase